MSGRVKAKNHILMSIKTYYADQIYSGHKSCEFRRVRCKFNPGDRIFIYESGGRGMVTGECQVVAVHSGSPNEVIANEVNFSAREEAQEYLRGCRVASAILINNVTRWKPARDLEAAFPGVRPPQSYQYVST